MNYKYTKLERNIDTKKEILDSESVYELPMTAKAVLGWLQDKVNIGDSIKVHVWLHPGMCQIKCLSQILRIIWYC